MGMSLKNLLTEYLKSYKSMNLNELAALCDKDHKKISNAERRLRELMDRTHASYIPNIGTERNNKGAIVGYKWHDVVLMSIAGRGGSAEQFFKDFPIKEEVKTNQLF